ncbi:MAG: DUF4392 domain-containing protein [Candidatus Rokubacteria bacterium]|nr:DUF4392 domain-containing protein [Candidatus Rokubacteria bacterium]
MAVRGGDLLDQILALDPGARGIHALVRPGAATAAARALHGARRVLIATGFSVRPGMPETDGPPGAAVLGRALRRLGARVRWVTDRANVAPLEAALGVLGEPSDVVVYPAGGGTAQALLAAERPTHLVAIERPGRTRSGAYLSTSCLWAACAHERSASATAGTRSAWATCAPVSCGSIRCRRGSRRWSAWTTWSSPACRTGAGTASSPRSRAAPGRISCTLRPSSVG